MKEVVQKKNNYNLNYYQFYNPEDIERIGTIKTYKLNFICFDTMKIYKIK